MARNHQPEAADLRHRPAVSGAIPDELAAAVASEAARDAENVAVFLSELGITPSNDHRVQFPAAFLLALGAALRLLMWESSNLRFHQDSGLPGAERAIIDAFRHLELSAEDEIRHFSHLPRKVVALFADRFAWHGRADLNADVVLDDHVQEDTLLDALAQLLWDARHARAHALDLVTENRDG
jgi:hypothetical protein